MEEQPTKDSAEDPAEPTEPVETTSEPQPQQPQQVKSARGRDVLSQEEIDVLLGGDGDRYLEEEEQTLPGVAQSYSFGQKDRIVRGRLPTLEMINDRFSRYFRSGLFDVLRKTCEVSVLGITMVKFSEYMHSLVVPSDLNLTRVHPLRGTALTVFEPNLVFGIIDNFFGGDGRFLARVEGREFTPMENRVIQIVLEKVFQAMHDAWAPVMPIEFKFVNTEVNMQFANIVSPTETVVVSRFNVDLDGGGGEIHITMPYAMLEPIRELLSAGVQSDRAERDSRWMRELRDEVLGADVEIAARIGEVTLSLREFAKLGPGDVVLLRTPPGQAVVYANEVPVFRGKFGTRGGNQAIRFEKPVVHADGQAYAPDAVITGEAKS